MDVSFEGVLIGNMKPIQKYTYKLPIEGKGLTIHTHVPLIASIAALHACPVDVVALLVIHTIATCHIAAHTIGVVRTL
ncbi:MAG: hypothetical protein AB2693_13595 [Candidatus Thiodiazotropha sp.]